LLGEICVLVENYSVDQEVMIDNEAPTRGLVVVPTSKLPTSEEGESSMGMSEMPSYRDDASSVGQQTRILGAEGQSLNEMGFQHTENDFLVVARDKELKGTVGDGLNRAIPKEGDDISQEVPDECNVLPRGESDQAKVARLISLESNEPSEDSTQVGGMSVAVGILNITPRSGGFQWL
jgi:hypothetical protein